MVSPSRGGDRSRIYEYVTQSAWSIAVRRWRSAASIYNSDSWAAISTESIWSQLFDEKTARAWLFETNTRLDEEAPIDVLRQGSDPVQFAAVRAAARQLVSFEG